MKTNPALTTTAPATKPRRAPSMAQNTQRQTVQMLGQIWRSLSFAEKSTWVSAANQIHGPNPSSATSAPKVTGYLTFTQIAGSLYQATGVVPRTATLPPTYPAAFGSVRLTTSGSGASFRLNIVSSTAYTDKVIVRAAPPVPAGHTTYKKGAFKIIGTLSGLTLNTDISALWTANYLAPGPGAAIAVEIIGMSASGLRSASFVYTVVTGLSESDNAPKLTLGK